MRDYIKFLAHQLKGWPQQNYYLFYFNLGCQVMTLVTNPITWISIITFIGTTLGVLCILAINAAKSVNGLLGLLSALCFIITGWAAKNYLSIFTQISYVMALDVPVLISKNWNMNMVSKIRKFKPKNWVIAICLTIVTYLVSGYAIGHLTNDPRPWIDAISFAIGLSGSVICFLRYSDQYVWWFANDFAGMVLWFVSFHQGSATLAMFVNATIYLINDFIGFTVSPWFNKKEHDRLVKEEKAYEAKYHESMD